MPSSWAASIIRPGQLQAAGAAGGVVVGQRVGPVEERAEAADGDADLVGHLADRAELRRGCLRREVVVEVVVQLDPVEPGVLGELEALAERHPLRVGERPEVDRLLHAIRLGRTPKIAGRPGQLGPGHSGPSAAVPAAVDAVREGRATMDSARFAGGSWPGPGVMVVASLERIARWPRWGLPSERACVHDLRRVDAIQESRSGDQGARASNDPGRANDA